MPFTIPDRASLVRAACVVVAALAFAMPAAAQQVATPTCDVNVAALRADTAGSHARPVGALRAGDLLKITVFRNKELSSDYLIDSEGRLVIPGLGAFAAAGLTPAQVEGGLRELLACRGLVPDVAVQAQIRVSVLGEVRSPGVFPVDPGATLLQVITMAGGETPRADLRATRVIREGRSYPVDLQAALNGGAAGNIVLNSDDVVVVPKKSGITREDAAVILSAVSALATVVNLVVSLSHK